MPQEDLLPNCLTRTPKINASLPFPGTWFFLYCANCGVETSYVRATELPAEYAFSLCNDCVEKYGEPAGFTKTPDDVFREKVENAMIERYGHSLNLLEIIKELDDKSSVITKLEKEAQRRQ